MSEPDITTLRLDQPGIRAALGDLEAEIMDAVWRRPNGVWVTDHFVGEAIEHLMLNFSGATRSRLRRVTDPAQQERLMRLLQGIESERTTEEQG